MGYYIEVPNSTSKARQIADGWALVRKGDAWKQAPAYKAEIIDAPPPFADIPDGKALICVIANALFEAAGYCHDEREFRAFTEPGDNRQRTWVLMDKDAAELCSGYARKAAV